MVAMQESRRARQRTPSKRGRNKNTGDLQGADPRQLQEKSLK
jgi:hypothetical protein